jgi:hypothetical protein
MAGGSAFSGIGNARAVVATDEMGAFFWVATVTFTGATES